MTLKSYIIIMLLATVFCWVSFFYVVLKVDPSDTSFLGFVFFYFSLFLAVVGSGSVFGLFLRMRKNKDEIPVFRLVAIAYRQSIWLAILIVTSFLLLSNGLLTWWNMLLFIFILTALEFFIMNATQVKKQFNP